MGIVDSDTCTCMLTFCKLADQGRQSIHFVMSKVRRELDKTPDHQAGHEEG